MNAHQADILTAAAEPSRFYAWLKVRQSKRAQEDKRQTVMLKEAWVERGKTPLSFQVVSGVNNALVMEQITP